MVYSGDPGTFVPSHERAVSLSEQWLIDRAAERFLRTGEWPKLDNLKRDAARAQVELPEIIHGMPVQDFLWRPDNEGTVVLSITGIARAPISRQFVEQFLQVVLLCRDIYLGDGDEEPKVTSEALRSKLGFDETTIARVKTMLPFEYYLTRGGGATSDTEWFYFVNETVARFRDVSTVEEYFAIRAEIVRPRPLADPWPGMGLGPVGRRFGYQGIPDATHIGEMSAESGPIAGPDPRAVFVVHGRDLVTKNAMCQFLESLGLHPLDWDEMVRLTKKGTPYTGDVIEHGFSLAQAFVVLMTPDDEARLHNELHEAEEPDHERNLTCQPRPNVLFEAGMAFGAHGDRTIIVHVGKLRPISDLAGRNVVVLGPTKATLKTLADRLEAAGCPVERSGLDAFDPSRFGTLPSLERRAATLPGPAERSIPAGRVISPSVRPVPSPRLAIKVHDRGKDHLLEIANLGGVTLNDVEWSLPDDAHNWHLLNDVLPVYPLPSLEPQGYVRVPLAISMGGPAYVDLTIRAKTPTGDDYEITKQLSIFG